MRYTIKYKKKGTNEWVVVWTQLITFPSAMEQFALYLENYIDECELALFVSKE